MGGVWAAQPVPEPAAALRAEYLSRSEQLQHSPFRRPLVVQFAESPNRLTGQIYAVVEYPFTQVSAGLDSPAHWCDVISLHINTKYCRPAAGPTGAMLRVHIGKKSPQDVEDAARVDFAYRVATKTPEYLEIVLNARDGPLGTSDYRIVLEAVALPDGTTFLHLTYSYAFNFAGRLAMQAYLGTLARDKVGFTPTGPLTGDGPPRYIGGMRGLVERNAMRYYLAIDAFLEAAGAQPVAQFERRLNTWFAATEQYPRQLHEIDRSEYLRMKRAENQRQLGANY